MQIKMLMTASALALVLGALPALAQGGGYGAGSGARPALPSAVFDEIDSDGDGQISLEEWTAFLTDHRAERVAQQIEARVDAIFEAGDADGDGQLTREELTEALTQLRQERMAERQSWRERRGQMHGQMRGMRYGQAAGRMRGEPRSEQDAQAGQAERPGERARGQAGRMMGRFASTEDRAERMFQRIDSDGDGFISPEELAAAQEHWENRVARFEQRMQRRMERGRARDGRGGAQTD